MRVLVSSLLVALVSLVGAALTPAAAAQAGIAATRDLTVAAPLVQKAHWGRRRGWGGYYGYRPYYYGHYYRPYRRHYYRRHYYRPYYYHRPYRRHYYGHGYRPFGFGFRFGRRHRHWW